MSAKLGRIKGRNKLRVFGNRVLTKTFRPKRKEAGEKCTAAGFMIFTHQKLSAHKI
jgi:hypothetical protein